MSRSFFLWPLVALAAAGGAFLAVRTALPGSGRTATTAAAMTNRESISRSTAELEKALVEASACDDVLLRRLRFLEVVESADSSELRRMMLNDRTTRREKRAIAQRWAETNPPGLLDFLKGVSPSDQKRDQDQYSFMRYLLFHSWAQQDPDTAMAAARDASHHPAFRNAPWRVVESLFSTDLTKAFALAATVPRGSMGHVFPESAWKSDPAGFVKAAGEGPARSLGNNLIRTAVESAWLAWMKQEPGAAAAWLAARPPDQRRRLWANGAALMARADPAAARAWFDTLPPSSAREQAGAAIVQEWAQKDPRAALEWMQDKLQGGRTQAFASIAAALADTGIDNAKQLLEAMPPGNQRDEVVRVVAQTWAQKEFKPAIDWLLSLPPDDPGRRRTLPQLMLEWPDNDLPGAAAFVLANPTDPGARAMVVSIASQFFHQDPNAGIAWAASLPAQHQENAFFGFLNTATYLNLLPQAFAAIESLPFDAQSRVVERMVTQGVQLENGHPDDPARSASFLKGIPPSLRETARQAVEKSERATPARKRAALEALQ